MLLAVLVVIVIKLHWTTKYYILRLNTFYIEHKNAEEKYFLLQGSAVIALMVYG